jgi:TPR repeat protein
VALALSMVVLGGTAVAAEEPVSEAVYFAYPTADGVTWLDGFRGIVVARDGQEPQVVFSETITELVALNGKRLVMGWANNLFTFPAGSWTPRITSTEERIVALGASPEATVAFDALAGLWCLEKDGSWSRRESGIKDNVLGLAWYRGLWVATGATRGIELEDEEQELRYGGRATPQWELEQRSPRLWWSTDGVKWQPGSLSEPKYNVITAAACLNGQWLAASLNGALYGSTDGKSWERAGSLPKENPWAETRLVAMGGEFLIRYGEERWWRSANGRDWSYVPLAEGARVDTPFMKAGQVYAVGKRKSDRRVEVAPLSAFAEVPGLTATELAAKAAEDEKARLAAEAKAAEAKKIADDKALAEQKIANAKTLAEQKANEVRMRARAQFIDAWATKLAAWDVAMTNARDTPARLKLCKALHVDWKATHPGYTKDEAVTYCAALFHRVTGYEMSDASVYDFFMGVADFDNYVAVALPKALPEGYGALIKKMMADRVAVYTAKQKGLPAPVVPVRIKTTRNPPAPQSFDAPYDVEPVRLLAARGNAAAAYDLSLLYTFGQGVPKDPAASRFWNRQAVVAGLVIPEPAGEDKDARAKNWLLLAEQGSRSARYQYAVTLRDTIGDATAALEQLKLAAAAGHRNAMVEAYHAYLYGKGTEIDVEAAHTLLNEAVAVNFPLALAEQGWAYEAAAGVPRDVNKAAGLYRRAAELGNNWAMGRYADFLLAGHGVPVDEAAGRSWLRKASERGDKTATESLAALAAGKYQRVKLEVYTAPKKERPTFDLEKRRQLAESGDAAACYDLAFAYWSALGVRKDMGEGNRWLARAKAAGWNVLDKDKWTPGAEAQASWKIYADQGSIVAMNQVVSFPGFSDEERLALIRRAAEAGMAPSQRMLGILYDGGVGVPADQAEAFKWFKRAAEIGDILAQGSLGYAYESGRGVARDHAQAVHWYARAAEEGNEIAMANLANLLVTGTGVTADPETAASWYLKLAGLPADKVSPQEAATRVRAAAEAGDSGVFAVWGIMLRRGFGVPVDDQAGFAYGFVATGQDAGIYRLNWFEASGLRRAPALRLAAGIAARHYTFNRQELAKHPKVAANIASGKFPTFEGILAQGAPHKSTVLPVLRALQDGLWTDDLADVLEGAREPFAIPDLPALVTATHARLELAGQPGLLRLAGVTAKTTDADEVETLFQKALIAPAANAADTARLQTLRRLAAARLYYGIGREADRPAALAWAMISVTDADSLFAVELLSRELSAAEIDSADELFQRINARLAPAKK